MKSRRSASLMIAVTGIVACSPEPPSPYQARPTVSACDRSAQLDYFGGQLSARADWHDAAQAGSQTLQALGEPPLYCGRPESDEEYRLLERDSFGAYVDVVRVSRHGDEYRITGTTTLRRSLRFGGEMRIDRQLMASEWMRIVKAIEQVELWRSPPDLPTPPEAGAPIRFDGGSYIVEGRRGSQYRAL